MSGKGNGAGWARSNASRPNHEDQIHGFDDGGTHTAYPCRPLLIGMGWSPPQYGGLNRYLRCLHEALEQAGEQPTAIVLGPATDAPLSVRVTSDHQARLWNRLAALTGSVSRLTRSAGVIDAHFALYALPSRFLPAARRLPFVVHFQGPWAQESALIGERTLVVRAKRVVEQAVYRQANVLVVLSPAFKQLLVRHYRVAPWRVRVLSPGVDLGAFCPGNQEAARRRLGLDQSAWVVLTVRRLVPRMGLNVLVRAWSDVRLARPDAVLLVVGSGPEQGTLQRQVEQTGCSDSVHFLGDITDEELTIAYRAASMSVLPTLFLEGFGLVALESMACGTPVVVTAVDGLAQIPARLDPTTVLPPGDADALARRICQAADGSLSLPSGEKCRKVAEEFSWDSVAKHHGALYRDLTHPRTDARLRVVYVDHVACLSGGELALLRLVPVLPGVEGHVILAEDGPLTALLVHAGVSVEVLPMAVNVRNTRRTSVRLGSMPRGVLGTLTYSMRLAQRLRALEPDLVHTNSLKAAVYGGLAARLAGIPLVWHVRDRIAPDYLPELAVRFIRLLARTLPQAIITNSATTLATLGPGIRNALAIPDLVVAPPITDSPHSLRSRSASFTIGMVGRLAPWKGQDVFLRAFAASFSSTNARAILVGGALFGEEQYERSLHDLVGQLDIASQVEFTGHRDDVGEELARFDALVHASVIPEPFGQVVLEGMAAGLAVVAADAGGPAEVITHGVDGLLVPPGNVDALAQTLKRLSSDAELRAVLGQRARQEAGRFTAEAITPQIMAVYESTLGPLATPTWRP